MKRTGLVGLVGLVTMLVLVTPSSSSDSSGRAMAQSNRLEDAYKREYAFLEAEKRALDGRIADEKASAAKRIAAARAEIAALQGSVVARANEAEAISELMLSAERDIQGLEESTDVVADILVRAEVAFDKVSVKLPPADMEKRAEVLARLSFAFERAPAALASLASVRREKGVYFDAAGKQVEGDILRVGSVAAYGLAPGAEGALAPAGENRLKLWQSGDGSSAAATLGKGGQLGTLPIFLFESLDRGVETKVDQSLREFINTGGIIGWVIVFLGLSALGMVLIRFVLITSATLGASRCLPGVLAHLDRGEIDEAIDKAAAAKSSTGRVIVATLRNIERDRGALEDVVAEAVLAEQPRLARFGTSIIVIAAVSPLLGLLGTVTGMISTFDIITEFGTGNPKLLSGGISEALVTTELGLIVAIPALLLGHMLSGIAEKARDNLDAAALSTVNRANGMRVDDVADQPRPTSAKKSSDTGALPEPA